jgi:hypothetical protein
MTDVNQAFEEETTEETVEETVEKPAEDTAEAETVEEEVKPENETAEDSEDGQTDESEDEVKSVAFKQAYMDEKRKRQRMEERISELEQLVPKQEEELPDPFEDPEGYKEAIKAQARREVEDEAGKARMKRIEDRRTELMENNDDFLQMEQIFDILSVREPEIRQEMIESTDPVQYAYDKAKAYHDEVMRPEVVLSTEMPDESETEDKTPPPESKPNLAKASAGASNKVEVEQDDKLNDVFADQKY